jgi:(R)-2-hydroxyacyl-CoA dehydratese activating ATPase
MPVAGIDVGAGTAKAVILSDHQVQGYSIVKIKGNILKAVDRVTKEALTAAKLASGDLQYIISTGYGRSLVSLANETITEISCHAKGAHYFIPGTRLVIDIGAQDSKGIKLAPDGRVTNFVMNDKCAAGTGRFLEVMAMVLGIELEEMGVISRQSTHPASISNMCTVFAETEIISLRAQNTPTEDLVAGLHKALAARVALMATPLQFEKEIVFTGGVAKNLGVKNALEERIGMEILLPPEPQIVGALGAALWAESKSAGNHTLQKAAGA